MRIVDLLNKDSILLNGAPKARQRLLICWSIFR